MLKELKAYENIQNKIWQHNLVSWVMPHNCLTKQQHCKDHAVKSVFTNVALSFWYGNTKCTNDDMLILSFNKQGQGN